jgi:hypothetical protein
MYPGHQNVLGDLFALLQTQAAEVQAGTRPQNDADYQLTITRLTEAVYIAGWRLTLARFRRLRLAFIAIVPAVAGSVLIMVSHAEPAAAQAKALDPRSPWC